MIVLSYFNRAQNKKNKCPVDHLMLGQVDVPEGEDAIQAPHPSVLMSLAKLLDREC